MFSLRTRFIIFGILIGIVVGVIASLFFPNLLLTGVNFNYLTRKSQGLPDYVIGSSLDGFYFYPLLFGLIGGAIGFLVFKITRNRE